MPLDNAPMGTNFDLQNGGNFYPTGGLKGELTLRTASVVTGKEGILYSGGQMAVIASAMPRLTALLPTRPLG